MKKFSTLAIVFCYLLIIPLISHADTTVKLGLIKITSTDDLQKISVPHLFDHTILFFGNNNINEALYTEQEGKVTPVVSQGFHQVSNSDFNFYRFINNILFPDLSSPSFKNNCFAFYGENRRNNKGIYTVCNNNYYKIVDTQTTVPNSSKTYFSDVYKPWIIDENNVAFIGEANQLTGLYIGDIHQNIKLLINHSFKKITELTFSPNKTDKNEFIFIGINAQNEPTLYHYDNNKLQTIADNKTQIPEGIGYFTNFSSISYDANSGWIAFIGTGIMQQKGIYLFNGNKLIKLVDQKSTTPNSFYKFTDYSALSMNNRALVFEASYDENKQGLFLIEQDTLIKLITTEDKIDNKNISKIELGNPAFNGTELVFLVTTTDGNQMIYKGVIQKQ